MYMMELWSKEASDLTYSGNNPVTSAHTPKSELDFESGTGKGSCLV